MPCGGHTDPERRGSGNRYKLLRLCAGGRGKPIEVLERLTDPFFEWSLRDPGNLGAKLRIVHAISHQNLGTAYADETGRPRPQPVERRDQLLHIDHRAFEVKHV